MAFCVSCFGKYPQGGEAKANAQHGKVFTGGRAFTRGNVTHATQVTNKRVRASRMAKGVNICMRYGNLANCRCYRCYDSGANF